MITIDSIWLELQKHYAYCGIKPDIIEVHPNILPFLKHDAKLRGLVVSDKFKLFGILVKPTSKIFPDTFFFKFVLRDISDNYIKAEKFINSFYFPN